MFSVGVVFGELCQFDDRFEVGGGNDTPATATEVMLPFDENYLISQSGDDDFYTFRICAQGDLYIDCYFEHAGGDIDISLHRVSDDAQLAISQSSTDNESIHYQVGNSNEEIYILVRMFTSNECNSYRLQVELDCPYNNEICHNGVDDDFDGDVDCDDYGCVEQGPVYFGLNEPVDGEVVGGVVVIEGSSQDLGKMSPEDLLYSVYYATSGSGSYVPVDPELPSYTWRKINEPLTTWDTIGQGIPDGNYDLRLRTIGQCGNWNDYVSVTVDNTAPVAEITEPLACTVERGQVVVRGTASDANLAGWVLQYSDPATSSWQIIATGTSEVVNDILGVWDTSGLDSCCYTLQLIVNDRAIVNSVTQGRTSEYVVPVRIGLEGDADMDNDVDYDDLRKVAQDWLGNW